MASEMKPSLDERGLAMLEAVIATAIIGVLASIALPKLGNMLDEVYADYEIRGVHSLAHYAQSVSRMATYKTFGFNYAKGYSIKNIEFAVSNTLGKTQHYSVRQYQKSERIKEQHFLKHDFIFSLTGLGSSIRFRANGNLIESGGHILLQNETRKVRKYLYITNYGRISIALKER